MPFSCCVVLQKISKQFQWLPRSVGGSTRHERNMEATSLTTLEEAVTPFSRG
jgi:hypothetical protein